jgi:hypothetical protein
MRATIVLAVLLAAASAADEPRALEDLLAAVGRYVRGFQRDFASVISDETYEQRDCANSAARVARTPYNTRA